MNRTVGALAFAKLNLSLSILSKRADGFHELHSVMQSVSLFDRVTLTRTADGVFTFKMTEGARAHYRSQTLNQSIEIVRRRIDELGTREPTIQQQGVNRALSRRQRSLQQAIQHCL